MMHGSRPRLPKRTHQRIVAIVERSRPNLHKPPLPADVEARLAPIEEKSAYCYAQMEEMTHRAYMLADMIDPAERAATTPGLQIIQSTETDTPLPDLPTEDPLDSTDPTDPDDQDDDLDTPPPSAA